MYNSTKDSIPLMDQKNEPQTALDIPPSSNENFKINPFHHDDSNKLYWKKVNKLYRGGKLWDDALTTVQAEDLMKECQEKGKDPMYHLLKEIHDDYMNLTDIEGRQRSGFINQLTKLGSKILYLDKEEAAKNKETGKYREVMEDTSDEQTLLHMLADRDLIDLCEIYVNDYYPQHLYSENVVKAHEEQSSDDKRYNGPKIPFEMAYTKCFDKTAAFLASKMKPYRVREVFQKNEEGKLRCSLAVVINKGMEETAIQVLDCCINPDWPFIPVEKGKVDETWSKLKEDPTAYHFYYNILDSDQAGNSPKEKGFDHFESSPLQLLVTNEKTKKSAISHPTVVVLVKRKWEEFGKIQIFKYLGLYLFFLLMLALGLFWSESWHPTVDKVIKIIVVIFNVLYTIEEIDQMSKEKRDYLDWFNLVDIFGILTIYTLIPLYIFGEYKAYYGVASAAFILNFIRVLKFFSTFEVGNYAKVFFYLLKEDVWTFLQFFAVLMVAFTGAVFLALKSEKSDGGKIVDGQNDTLTFWSTMLRETRALAEGKEFADDYDGVYTPYLIIFLLMNMAAIIVVLSNILIGQISARYEKAADNARVESAIAKAKYICKIEKSRFVWRNFRIDSYIEGDHITDEGEIQDILTDWYELKTERQSSREAIKKLQEGLKKRNEVSIESRMEEMKAEMESRFDKLKEESDSTKQLLQQILQRIGDEQDE
eukprot:TCONS_00034861-protein